MKSIALFIGTLIITYIISNFTNLKPTINYSDKFEYIPIITANIYADILIGVIYILIARYLVYKLKLNVSLFQFALIAVAIQLVLDFVFYLFFSSVPVGSNHMLDFFKRYAKESGYNALLGDSILVLFAVIISALLNEYSFDVNIISLIVSIYLIPYFIYMK